MSSTHVDYAVWTKPGWCTVCTPVLSVVGRWQLCLADSGTLIVPRVRTMIHRRDIAVSGPVMWNSQPVELQTSTLSTKTFIKTEKSSLWLLVPLRTLSNWCYIKYKYTYLYIHQLSLVQSLVGVKPKSGAADPGATVTWPDTKVVAWLRPKLAYSSLVFKGCDS